MIKQTTTTIAVMGTICILVLGLTILMKLSIQYTQPCRFLNCVGITTTVSGPWVHNTDCWVFLHNLEKINIAFLASTHFRQSSFQFNGVQVKYNIETKWICRWKVWLRLFSSLDIYGTHMLWASGKIPRLVFIYCTLQWKPRCFTEVGLWHSWQ